MSTIPSDFKRNGSNTNRRSYESMSLREQMTGMLVVLLILVLAIALQWL